MTQDDYRHAADCAMRLVEKVLDALAAVHTSAKEEGHEIDRRFSRMRFMGGRLDGLRLVVLGSDWTPEEIMAIDSIPTGKHVVKCQGQEFDFGEDAEVEYKKVLWDWDDNREVQFIERDATPGRYGEVYVPTRHALPEIHIAPG